MVQRRSGRRKSRSRIEIASLARSHTDTVINMLIGIVTREDVAPNARIAAGLALLDRGWGKPLQKIELDDDRPDKIDEIIIRIVDPKSPLMPALGDQTGSDAVPLLQSSQPEGEHQP